MFRKNLILAVAVVSALLAACGAPTPDLSSEHGRAAVLTDVDILITQGQCGAAVAKILPLYNSPYSDNEVRKRAASAYACNARINYFAMTSSLVENASLFAGTGFWAFLTKTFYSTAGSDYIVEGAFLATDALQAMMRTTALTLPLYQVNPGSYNVGSVFGTDRDNDANIYMIYVAMAAVGSLQARHGNANPVTGAPITSVLPWTIAATVDTNGCGYAGEILTLVDAVNVARDSLPSSFSTALTTFTSNLKTAMDMACDWGCKGGAPTGDPFLDPNSQWVDSGCNLGAVCSAAVGGCPAELRNRSKCTGAVSEKTSCAAAGITNFMNFSSAGWR